MFLQDKVEQSSKKKVNQLSNSVIVVVAQIEKKIISHVLTMKKQFIVCHDIHGVTKNAIDFTCCMVHLPRFGRTLFFFSLYNGIIIDL